MTEAEIGGYKYQTGGKGLSVKGGVGAVKNAVKGSVGAVKGVVKGSVGAVKGAVAGSWSKIDKGSNFAVKFVTGGKLTPQGTVALVCYAIMLVTAAISPLVAAKVGLQKGGFAALAAVLLSAALSVYGINCMVVGGCSRLSWFYVAMLVLWTVGVVSGAAYMKYGAQPAKVDSFGIDARLQPDILADAPQSIVAPARQVAGQPPVASPDQIAASSNVIYQTQKDNLYEGYDAQGNEDDAPTPWVDGEMASAS